MALFDSRPSPTTAGQGGAAAGTDPNAQFRCDHPRDVLALLRRLRDNAVPVTLSGPGGTHLNSSLWTVDESHQRLALEVESGDTQLANLVEGNEATAVAYLDAIKVQFDVQDLVLVRSTKAAALQCDLPPCLYRFQRRSSYRVRTLERSAPTAHLRHPGVPDMQLNLRILDLSVGGCALLLPDDMPSLPLGVVLHGVDLVLDTDTRARVNLRLQHASSISAHHQGLRLGCEFLSLDVGAERNLQRYIDQTQKRRRLLSLD
jgi:flagellar brake protein